MLDERLSSVERMEGALTNVQVITWLSRESWDIVFLLGRTLFLRKSKNVEQTVGIGLALGPLFGGLLLDKIGGHGVQSQKEISTDEIEAMKKGCIEAYEFMNQDFPPCKMRRPIWAPR